MCLDSIFKQPERKHRCPRLPVPGLCGSVLPVAFSSLISPDDGATLPGIRLGALAFSADERWGVSLHRPVGPAPLLGIKAVFLSTGLFPTCAKVSSFWTSLATDDVLLWPLGSPVPTMQPWGRRPTENGGALRVSSVSKDKLCGMGNSHVLQNWISYRDACGRDGAEWRLGVGGLGAGGVPGKPMSQRSRWPHTG